MTKKDILALDAGVIIDRMVAQAFWNNTGEIVAKYSMAIKSAFKMEKKVEDSGLHLEYAWKLAEVVTGNEDGDLGAKELWDILHATALQRCKAGLLVILEAKR